MAGAAQDLSRGRRACRHRAWAEAVAALSAADEQDPLSPWDLEQLATAAYLRGHVEVFLQALQRAAQGYAGAANPSKAARCMFWVGLVQFVQGDHAQAGGWLARASRLLADVPDCAEHGLLLIAEVFRGLATGEYEAAEATAVTAAEIGARAGDAELTAMAMHYGGRAVARRGRVSEGMAMLDEAMVAVVADDLWAPVTGHLYCSTIEACMEVSDVRRAHEWTAALEGWWDGQPQMVTFTGSCLVHRAEILALHGSWPEAIEQARRACERLAEAADVAATGAAMYRLAEVSRTSGDFAAAQDRYLDASQWGHDPQPGLALLRLAQGQPDAAAVTIRRAEAETTGQPHRSKLLPAYVEVMLAVGDVPAARRAADELGAIADDYDTEGVRAAAGQAMGAVLLEEGDARAALVTLRAAWQCWQHLEAPYDAARTRLLIALGCRALGDEESAGLEFDVARRVFTELGAASDLRRTEALRRARADAPAHGLSARELQVLRLLATGKTNHAIARDLVLADKTVDRHVTNIFAKLGVSSRAAATAYAHRQRLA